MTIDLSRGGSTAHRLEKELLRAIVSLELYPGVRLSEQEIAERYGVSRQPVREALIALSKQQFVEVLPQRGTIVVKISIPKMREARFLREVIESAVVRRACEAFDPVSREKIDEALEAQARAAARTDHTAFKKFDEEFHIALAEGAGCSMAWSVVGNLKAHMDRACQLTLLNTAAMQLLIDQHQAIIVAIDARNPDAAEAAMRYHLTEILRVLPEIEKNHPDLFE
ncbi:GntR family transcriptional regulator [Phyllobacterium myrsinacearum]|uniref:DNA-binding GntR family transcriptional regulator n=1 Tax=Phyllobacterium myrsinacearum TaxID=28101 RepID=A0A839EE76_9HYPH|nr:GntR family transcriptional regulator [Phyllobacterium myrsinacearum]MBA8878383.1 DNA-binding GntR family transcriptional regulator [Phyllobacterium myrsinacearum]